MPITTIDEKFTHELEDIYDAEHRFLKGQQSMLTAATDPELKNMIETHIDQTQQHIKSVEEVFSILGQKATGHKCDAAAGIVAEVEKTLKEAQAAGVRDCLIGSEATKAEHYEIVSYRGLVADADALGQKEASKLLSAILKQEEQTAQKLEATAPVLLKKAQAAETR